MRNMLLFVITIEAVMVLAGSLVYAFLHPTMTHTELFLALWPWWCAAVVPPCVVAVVLEFRAARQEQLRRRRERG